MFNYLTPNRCAHGSDRAALAPGSLAFAMSPRPSGLGSDLRSAHLDDWRFRLMFNYLTPNRCAYGSDRAALAPGSLAFAMSPRPSGLGSDLRSTHLDDWRFRLMFTYLTRNRCAHGSDRAALAPGSLVFAMSPRPSGLGSDLRSAHLDDWRFSYPLHSPVSMLVLCIPSSLTGLFRRPSDFPTVKPADGPGLYKKPALRKMKGRF